MYTVRLMPTEEAMRSLWDGSARISRGIKRKNMQRKTPWKDKWVGTLWRTQKRKPSPGNNITFYSPWTWWEFSLILSFAYNVDTVWPGVCVCCCWWKRRGLLQDLENYWLQLCAEELYLGRNGLQYSLRIVQFSENPPWKSFLYTHNDFIWNCTSHRSVYTFFLFNYTIKISSFWTWKVVHYLSP